MWTNATKDRTRPDEAAREFQEMSMTGEYGSMSDGMSQFVNVVGE